MIKSSMNMTEYAKQVIDTDLSQCSDECLKYAYNHILEEYKAIEQAECVVYNAQYHVHDIHAIEEVLNDCLDNLHNLMNPMVHAMQQIETTLIGRNSKLEGDKIYANQ